MKRWRMHVALPTAVTACALAACYVERTGAPRCSQGDARGCVGPGTCQGGQICGPDGYWTACYCEAGPTDGRIPADPSDGGPGGDLVDRNGHPPWNCEDYCASYPSTTVCDPSGYGCVECLPGEEDACGIEAYCGEQDKCVLGCAADDDCPTGSCDLVTHRCTGCVEDDECALGTLCDRDTGVCIPGCTSARRCPTNWTCCDGQCANLFTSDDNCGACGSPCDQPPNTQVGCTNGECRIDGCDDAYDDCDAIPDNGCETDVAADENNCGQCGNRCDFSEVCNNGVCGLRCEYQEGFADCDGDPANGCEEHIATSLEHCGACYSPCALDNADVECVNGTCSIVACERNFSDCDQVVETGCEANTLTDVDHCGYCQRPCSAIRGTPMCADGRCSIECNAGFGDCDGAPANGCETVLDSDSANCGGCGIDCGGGSCVDGACG